MIAHVAVKALLLAMAVVAAFVLAGCCTYKGKRVSNDEAERMIRAGMDVQC